MFCLYQETDLESDVPFHSRHFRARWQTKSEALKLIGCASFRKSHASVDLNFLLCQMGIMVLFSPPTQMYFRHMPCASSAQVENTEMSQTWSPLSSSAGQEGRRGNIPANTQDPREQYNSHSRRPRSGNRSAGDRCWLGRTQRQGSRVSRSWPGLGLMRRPRAKEGGEGTGTWAGGCWGGG